MKGQSRAVIAGLLDHDPITRVEEHSGNQVERLLRAIDDDDLTGVAGHASGAGEVLRQSLPQRSVSGRRSVTEGLGQGASYPCRYRSSPSLAREIVKGGPTIAEVIAKVTARIGNGRRHVAQALSIGGEPQLDLGYVPD